MVAAKKQTITAVVASVFADGNDVRCLNHFQWGVTKSATLTAITPNDCCSKRCLTALLGADLVLGRLPRLEARTFFVRRQLVVPSPTKREGENQVAADRVVLQELIRDQWDNNFQPQWFITLLWNDLPTRSETAISHSRHFRNGLLTSLLSQPLKRF